MLTERIDEKRGGGVIFYIKESLQAYEITLKSETDCEEAICCNIVTKNSTLTTGVVYHSPSIGQEEDVKLQKAIREVSKGECAIMGYFNHVHIQWESLESAGGDDHQFLLLTQDCFLTQHVLEPNRGGNVLDLILFSQNEFVDNVSVQEPLGSSNHNHINFNIKVKTGNTYKKTMARNFNKGKYKEMRTYLANIDWNNLLKNKTQQNAGLV